MSSLHGWSSNLKPALRSTLGVLSVMGGMLLVALALLFASAALMGTPGDRNSGVPVVAGILVLVCLLGGVQLIRLAGRALRPARVVQVGLGLALVACIVIAGWLQQRGVFDRSKVRLSRGVLLIQGRLDKELLAEFRRVIQTADLRDVRVRLRSPGGDIHAGMAIGREIHHRKLDVEVDLRCISSCANYLFTAGRNKYLQSPDQVLFHGGALQPDFVAAALVLVEQGIHAVSGEDVPSALELQQWRELYGLADEYPFNAAAAILAEKAFYDEIGVSQLTPVLGQYGEYASWFMDGIHDNFYYLPEDYALLGVTNVIVGKADSDSRPGAGLFRASTSIAAIDTLQAQMTQVYSRIESAMPFGAADIWSRLYASRPDEIRR